MKNCHLCLAFIRPRAASRTGSVQAGRFTWGKANVKKQTQRVSVLCRECLVQDSCILFSRMPMWQCDCVKRCGLFYLFICLFLSLFQHSHFDRLFTERWVWSEHQLEEEREAAAQLAATSSFKWPSQAAHREHLTRLSHTHTYTHKEVSPSKYSIYIQLSFHWRQYLYVNQNKKKSWLRLNSFILNLTWIVPTETCGVFQCQSHDAMSCTWCDKHPVWRE